MKHFTFDGTVYPTGMTDAKIKKMEKEKEEILKKDAKVAVNAAQQLTNTGLGKDLLNKRAIFVYLRDISNLNPKQLSIAMSSIRKHYKLLVKQDEFDIFF